MKSLKKVLLVGCSLVLGFSVLYGAKKKNANKYIFAGGKWLVVFDGATKTVQRKQFGTNAIEPRGLLYFPKQKKIITQVDFGYGIYSIDVNNLDNYYQVDFSSLNQYGKPVNFSAAGLAKSKSKKDTVLFLFAEWNTGPNYDNSYYDNDPLPDNTKYEKYYNWNIANNSFIKTDKWDGMIGTDDPYAVENDFTLYNLTDEWLRQLKVYYEEDKNFVARKGTEFEYADKIKKKINKENYRTWRMGVKFKKLLENGKIEVGPYSQASDLKFMPTGGRYMVILNDQLYLVHMKTKEVYTLIPEPQNLNYFIIEKNEDDLDLDKE